MQRAWYKTCRTLMLAGWLGAGTAWAQQPASPAAPEPATIIEAARGQAWEVQVELALLAEPTTFSYAIKPQFASAGLVLRGYVPNDEVKFKALALARSLVPVEVVDRLVVHSAVIVPSPGEEFALEEARQRLRRVNAHLGGRLQLTRAESGQVTLAGQASSVAEMLEFARSLRGLPGCVAVKSNVEVSESAMAGVARLDATGEAQDEVVQPRPAQVVFEDGPPRPPSLVAPTPPADAESKQGSVAQPTDDPAPPPQVATVPPSAHSPMTSVERITEEPRAVESAPATTLSAPDVVPVGSVAPLKVEHRRYVIVPPAKEKDRPISSLLPPPLPPPLNPGSEQGNSQSEAVLPASAVRQDDSNPILSRPASPAELVRERTTPPTTSTPKVPAYETPPVPAPRVQTALRFKILQVLGGAASDATLTFDGQGGLEIILKVRPDADVGRAMSSVTKVAELSAYDVRVRLRRE